jgi:hypothetical protein
MRQPVMLSVLIPALGFSTELIQFESGKGRDRS